MVGWAFLSLLLSLQICATKAVDKEKCPTEWTKSPHEKCHRTVKIELSWNELQNACKSLNENARIITIDSQTEWTYYRDTFQNDHQDDTPEDFMWLGIKYSENAYQWHVSKQALPQWLTPNNSKEPKETCGALKVERQQKHTFTPMKCTTKSKLNYCEMPPIEPKKKKKKGGLSMTNAILIGVLAAGVLLLLIIIFGVICKVTSDNSSAGGNTTTADASIAPIGADATTKGFFKDPTMTSAENQTEATPTCTTEMGFATAPVSQDH